MNQRRQELALRREQLLARSDQLRQALTVQSAAWVPVLAMGDRGTGCRAMAATASRHRVFCRGGGGGGAAAARLALELAGMVRGAVRQNPAEQSGWFGSVLKPWADEPVTGSIDIIHSFSFPVFGPPAIF
jgi:hypothetical protein